MVEQIKDTFDPPPGIKRVTKFGPAWLNIEPERFKALPTRIREKIEVYNTNPDAFVRGPRIDGIVCYHFEVGESRMEELLEDMAALNA